MISCLVVPPARRTIANEDLGIFSRFRFRIGEANSFFKILFRNCFRNEHVGHAQATTAGHYYKKTIIPEIIFRICFRNLTEIS